MKHTFLLLGKKIVIDTGTLIGWNFNVYFQNKYRNGVTRIQVYFWKFYVCLRIYDKLRY